MSSIVLDLQSEITKTNCDIVNVLRRAHLIGMKLGLLEFDRWISCELNGYSTNDVIPDYRKVRGALKAFNPYRGWIPTMIPDRELENTICIITVSNSLSEIKALCKENKMVIYDCSGEQMAIFSKLFDTDPMRYALHVPSTSLSDIVEQVKNAVLDWTIRLEAEGIVGEGMRFSDAEIETAKRSSQTINNYYGNTNVINSSGKQIDILAGNESIIRTNSGNDASRDDENGQ